MGILHYTSFSFIFLYFFYLRILEETRMIRFLNLFSDRCKSRIRFGDIGVVAMSVIIFWGYEYFS